ncbi:hypothetical protein niasHT_014754 [Heterodera trifolii]|uniref:N-acetyltransferase domain-containing protein n=1 Tax=Heterodera trifolii TaxID=157864 RepID=A0ABD2L7C8_9BILA
MKLLYRINNSFLLFKKSRHFVRHFCSQNITKPTIKCDEQENFCSAPSCSSSSAHVHVQNRGQWPAEVLAKFLADCSVLGDFVSEEEETQLLDEVWPHMKRMRWEDEHWDGQIQRYREREQMLENWLPENQALIQRIWHTSFPAPFEPSPYVHILDLHQDGLISPHLDKSRYCGRVISGLSLLSASVMRMRHKSAELGPLCVADLLLSRRSLYRLSGSARYDFTHALLGADESRFGTQTVPRERRIALICREVVHHEVATCSTQNRQQQTIVTTDGEPLQLEWRWATRLDEADTAWAFDLFKRNMRQLYLKSQWGYDEWAKREELGATTARFLLVRTANGRLIAYVHFRFVEDEGRPVLYCYEIQVEPDYQQKGIGARLIEQLERLAEGTQMELLMATVFAFNGPSLAFFHKSGFRTDPSCRFGHDGPDGRDYVILSKHTTADPSLTVPDKYCNGHNNDNNGTVTPPTATATSREAKKGKKGCENALKTEKQKCWLLLVQFYLLCIFPFSHHSFSALFSAIVFLHFRQWEIPPRAALIHAILNRNTETAVFLLEKGADPHQTVQGQLTGLNMNVTPLWAAVIFSNLELCRALVDSLNADELSILQRMNQPEVQPPRAALINAILNRHTETAVFLLQKGADPQQTMLGQLNGLNMNMTALWFAANSDNLELCRALIAHGANVESGTDSGETALQCACFKGNLEIASLLVENSANINLPDTDGITPLIAASVSGQIDIVRLLLSHGAIVEQTDFTGMRFALMVAALANRLEVCRLLVDEWAADVNQEAIDGTSALIGASGEGHVDVAAFLIERGANLDHTDMEGYDSLMCAVKKGKTEMARHLVAIGANTDQIGTDGKRARDLAEESGIAEMIDIFHAAAEQRENVDGQQNGHQ